MSEILTASEINVARMCGVDLKALRAHKARELRAAASPQGTMPPADAPADLTLSPELAGPLTEAAQTLGTSPGELLAKIVQSFLDQANESPTPARTSVKFGAPAPIYPRGIVTRTNRRDA